MSTSSTVPTVKAALVSLLGDALKTSGVSGGPVPVDYAWPGADSEPLAVFLGRHPEFIANPLAATGTIRSEIATIKAGRKYRDENYEVELTIWSFRPDLSSTGAAEAESEGFTLLGKVEDVLADDPTLGLPAIQWASLTDVGVAVIPFQSGWASVLIPTIAVRARLT